jgi:hypothetical protein
MIVARTATKWSLVCLGLCIAYAWQQHRDTVRNRIVRENNVKAERLKDQLERLFPTGTPESVVLGDLKEQRLSPSQLMPFHDRVEHLLHIGSEPSERWYCGDADAYVTPQRQEWRTLRTQFKTATSVWRFASNAHRMKSSKSSITFDAPAGISNA